MTPQSPTPYRMRGVEPAAVPSIAAMDWPEAMRAVKEGQRVARNEWAMGDTYCLRARGRLMIHNDGEPPIQLHEWIVSADDMDATDWVVLTEGTVN